MNWILVEVGAKVFQPKACVYCFHSILSIVSVIQNCNLHEQDVKQEKGKSGGQSI